MRKLKPKHGQAFLYLLLLIVVIAGMGLTKKCSSSVVLRSLTQGESAGDTIDVAILYGPLSYYLYEDTLGGLNYELLKDMERQINRPVKLWPVVSLHAALQRLEENKFNLLASLPSANSVKERFLTTRSVFLDRMVLVQLEDSNGNGDIKSVLDLGKDTIYIPEESPATQRLANLSNETGNPIPVKEMAGMSEEYLCMKVATGSIPLAVVNEKTAAGMKNQYPRLSYDNPVSFTQFQVWVLPKNDTTLLHTIDNWLETYKATPSYHKLLDKYQNK